MKKRTDRIQTRRKKKQKKKIMYYILIPLFALLIGAGAFVINLFNEFQDVMGQSYEAAGDRTISDRREREPDQEPIIEIKEEPYSILVIGIDDGAARNWGEKSRTDVLIVVTVNPEDNTVKMMSIPRDSYTYIPYLNRKGHINHAHVYSGPIGTIETVEYLLDIPIDYYVRLNFQAFMGVVDALGGIEFDVPRTFSVVDSMDNIDGITVKKGLQTLNGEQALAVARVRSFDNDFERNKRQQELIKAIIKKTASAGSITKLDDVLRAVGTNMKTNLTTDDMIDIATYGVTNGLNLSIESLALTGKNGSDDKGSYIFLIDDSTLTEVKSSLRAHLQLN